MEKIGKKLKHNHTLTNILKFVIFSMVMLAPIFSVASRCLYVICNKNAKDSYQGKIDKIENIYINNLDYQDLPTGSMFTYYFVNETLTHDTSHSGWFTYDNLSFNPNLDFVPVRFRIKFTAPQSLQFNDGGSRYSYVNFRDFTFTLKSYQNNDDGILYLTNIFYQTVISTDTLDNAFEYSLSQLEESSYYNWATNLGIYTPINNMVSGLGGHSIISLLLAYWSIYTAIYIVFDIIITCFVKITHLIQGE